MFSGFLKNNEFNAQNNINKKWKIRHDLSNFENTSFVSGRCVKNIGNYLCVWYITIHR